MMHLLTVYPLLLLLAMHGISAQTRKQASAKEQADVVQQLIRDQELTSNCVKEEGGSSEVVAVELVDLNSDRVSELLVSGQKGCACGGRFCFQWLYRKTTAGYEMLLSAGPVEEVTPLRTVTKGYRDLRVIASAAGGSAAVLTYKFDGQHYTNQKAGPSGSKKRKVE